LIFYSDGSDYAANIEQATSLAPEKATTMPADAMKKVPTPGQKTIADIASFLKIPMQHTVKTLIVEGESQPLVALVLRGDDELNEIKAAKHPLIKSPLRFADEAHILKILGVPLGSIGPVKLDIPVIVDHQARAMESFVCGANEADQHFINAAWERDVPCENTYDLRNVKEGDTSPDGKGKLHSCRGIEVGHIFQLGDKYAKAMNATVINEEGQLQTMLMGTYGLGISRVVAAAIEQHHDENGIIWPQAIAPFQMAIIPINAHRCENVKNTAEAMYDSLTTQGIDVLLDDRNERPGVLFADSELIGIPHRLVVGERNLAEGMIEYKARTGGESQRVPLAELPEFVRELGI